MLFWISTSALFLFSMIGSIRLRAASAERYVPFAYACAAGWTLIPATTGDFPWMLATIPAAIAVARLILNRREMTFQDSASAKRPSNER
jgi:hypothetical protein